MIYLNSPRKKRISFRFAAKHSNNNDVSGKYEEESIYIEPDEDSDVKQERKDVNKYVTVRNMYVKVFLT